MVEQNKRSIKNMGICSFCGKPRARYTLFIGIPQPEDLFEHLRGEELGGEGRYIMHHAKCIPRDIIEKITLLGNQQLYDRDNPKRWNEKD